MGGAYTATPAEETPADLPPGWNLTWPYTGPWPPGYEPDLSLSLDATAVINPTDVVATLSVLTDQGSYVTAEPSSQIVWSAKWDDTNETLDLRQSEGTFSQEVSLDYADVGDSFWGADPIFSVDASATDNGRTFTLSANSSPFDGQRVLAQAVVTVTVGSTCEVDREYQQPTRPVAPEMANDCMDYVTDGMRVFEENTDSGPGGWPPYINKKITDGCDTPRFWMWTRYPRLNFEGATVGVIDKYGFAHPPLGGYDGGWTGTPQTGSGDGDDHWWLMQFLQERPGIEEDPTNTKPIFGTIHWSEITTWSILTCHLERAADGACIVWEERDHWSWTLEQNDLCNPEDRPTVYGNTDVCRGVLPPSPCTNLAQGPPFMEPGDTEVQEVSSTLPEEDEPLSTGSSFFKTWGYYIDQIFPDGY